jgi:hypothetical protein
MASMAQQLLPSSRSLLRTRRTCTVRVLLSRLSVPHRARVSSARLTTRLAFSIRCHVPRTVQLCARQLGDTKVLTDRGELLIHLPQQFPLIGVSTGD